MMEDDEHAPLPDPREFLGRQPKKSILKATSSFDKAEKKELSVSPTREAHFDEMNIVLTYHPLDKDYGHTKIDKFYALWFQEPKTPYNNYSDSEGDEGPSEGGVRRVSISDQICVEFDPDELSEKIRQKRLEAPKITGSDLDTDDEGLSPEQQERRHQFELKRKKHYNEFQAVKLAKEISTSDDDDVGEMVQQSGAACSGSGELAGGSTGDGFVLAVQPQNQQPSNSRSLPRQVSPVTPHLHATAGAVSGTEPMEH